MTLDQFRQLNDIEKVSTILEYGRLIAQSVDDCSRTFLYKIDSFFVSASYTNGSDELSEITCYLEVDQSVPHFRKRIISIDPAERISK